MLYSNVDWLASNDVCADAIEVGCDECGGYVSGHCGVVRSDVM